MYYKEITKHETSLIKAYGLVAHPPGYWDYFFNLVCDFSGIDLEKVKQFKNCIIQLGSTEIGNSVIRGLADRYNTSNPPPKIKFVFNSNTDLLGIASYNSNTNELAFNFDGDRFLVGYISVTIAHEFYHAFLDSVRNTPQPSVLSEVEAFLFAAMFARQYDDNRNIKEINSTESFYYNSGYLVSRASNNLSSSAIFLSEWNKIINDKVFTFDGLNKLIMNFRTGSSSGSAYNETPDSTYDDILDRSQINDLFNDYYKSVLPPPPPGDTSGGGGGGGNSSPSYQDNYFTNGSYFASFNNFLNQQGVPTFPNSDNSYYQNSNTSGYYYYDRNTGLLTDPSNPNAVYRSNTQP